MTGVPLEPVSGEMRRRPRRETAKESELIMGARIGNAVVAVFAAFAFLNA
jgi:hypothetical protein